ncbi:MAG: hypothetical protein KA371_11070 [Acidobacteria bacterium]|nr:hypothetical protein [Acidobacteriota bacterium]
MFTEELAPGATLAAPMTGTGSTLEPGSCVHRLHSTPARKPRAPGAPAWRTGIDLGAALEKVRVAKALPALPRISMAMQHGTTTAWS